MRAMNRTLIIIPTYDERDNVEPLTEEILDRHADIDILFVDDNSPDGTGAVCNSVAADDGRVNVIHREDKKGLGRAYLAGFRWALEREYECVFEMDADFSHRPVDIAVIRDAMAGADVVLGSRFIGGIRVVNWPLNRLFLSKAAALYVRAVTGMPFADPTGGFKCYRRRVLESIDLESITSNGYSFQIETLHRAWMRGFAITEVPITFEDRQQGQSKMSAEIVREAFWMVWKLLFSARGRRRPVASLGEMPIDGG